ncbi:hypothetical protein T439DRAFT_331111 [Meredithblackwellia eburnea MCA 4105]
MTIFQILRELATPFLALFAFLWAWRQVTAARPSSSAKSVAIVVLGDIGRSPRMLYHAKSFVEHGYLTHIVAFKGASLPQELQDSPHVHLVYIPTPLAFVSRLPRPLFLLLAPLKVVLGALALLWALANRIEHAPSFMLIQNPPAIPTLPIVKLAALLRGSKVIIDWHNTGYSILALRLREKSPVVRFAKWVETYFGQYALAHLCVTEAMKSKLLSDAKLKGRTVVFHDRPPAHFRRLKGIEAHEVIVFFLQYDLFQRLDIFHSPSLASFLDTSSSNPESTPFTILTSPSTADFREDRPALLVSATSWTADEDFSILLSALSQYDTAAVAYSEGRGGLKGSSEKAERLPKILFLITGKGAGKAAFEAQVREKEEKGEWKFVRVRTAWLAIEDYPKLLGACDLGVSLHTSSSGADLPMKVVDMFGCGLPVCALDFACISELVHDGVNGTVFKTAEDLANQLITLLRPFPTFPSTLDLMRAQIRDSRVVHKTFLTWEENWNEVVAPLVAP